LRSSLPLLVTRVRADHENPAVAPDDFALLAHWLDRRPYLHARVLVVVNSFVTVANSPALATVAIAATELWSRTQH
jgi:hypothetical protein